METKRWAVVQKFRSGDEEQYDTLQVCDSLEEAKLIEEVRRCYCNVGPWGDCEIFPYPSEQYDAIARYRQHQPIPGNGELCFREEYEADIIEQSKRYEAAHKNSEMVVAQQELAREKTKLQ